MSYFQRELSLKEKPRGFHLITNEIISAVPELKKIKAGILHIFIRHTSASLTINENYDPDVRRDFESHFNELVKENEPYYVHTIEGPDDMPAHLKASILGNNLSIPITNGALNLGTWQGVYLCEHRNRGGSRKLVLTISGE
ncbi:MAG TPA: secondary thiamine-phosphate synthase enzyme YjbQ [Desulfobacterales bacterium]|nr:secondary thiamine-phosphate synthase enzyme YjbQ [Desulfobacterales bacterium]